MTMPTPGIPAGTRVLLVLPSWIGDAVMATPALRRVRAALPGAWIGALARPGIDRLLEGLTDANGRAVFDAWHIERPTGVLGPKFTAARIRPARYTAALLLTGSFSTALIARIAGIPVRVGYDRDARGFLLTRRLRPPKSPHGGYAIVPAVDYYWHAAAAFLDHHAPDLLAAPRLDRVDRATLSLPASERLTLAITDRDHAEAAAVLASAGLTGPTPFALLNPGGNNPEKRWPADRYAALADHLFTRHGLRSLLNGSPAERDLCVAIAAQAVSRPIILSDHGHTLGALKALLASASCRVMVTNDTGPRHIAAALACPVVSLFGPTDARWTTIPTTPLQSGAAGETILVADPTLDPSETANDHPERCRIDRIGVDGVIEAVNAMLTSPA